jgi:hypothetical protein
MWNTKSLNLTRAAKSNRPQAALALQLKQRDDSTPVAIASISCHDPALSSSTRRERRDNYERWLADIAS